VLLWELLFSAHTLGFLRSRCSCCFLIRSWTNSLFLDVKVRVEAAAQLRDNLEHYITGPIYSPFLKKLIPIFKSILNGPPVFISTSAEQVRTQFLVAK
jgi:hypothetical protein